MLVCGCAVVTGDLDRIVGIEIEGSLERSVEENDSLQLRAWAIAAGGDTVPEAEMIWELLDADSGQVGFTIDGSTGLVVAHSPGSGRVRPRLEDVTPKEPITIQVTPAPDSLAPAGEQALSLAADAAISPALTVELYDLTTEPDAAVPLKGKEVHFLVVNPAPGTTGSVGFFLVLAPVDTVPQEDPHMVTVTTDDQSRASAFVKRIAGTTLPDSAVIHATASTAAGETVPGSPVRFVVIFENN